MIEKVIDARTDSLSEYLDFIVQPTFEDYGRNPHSARHAFLACIAVFHCVDRAAYPKSPGNLRKEWRRESFEFLIVDMFAHHIKHVQSSDETYVPKGSGIPFSFLLKDMDHHNMHFVVRDAITFIHHQVKND